MGAIDTKTIVEINRTATQFSSSIVLRVGDRVIDVKSILGLSVSLVTGQAYKLDIHGPDEEEAKAAMAEVFAKNGLQAEMN
ncbi:HPr family phosphocarrier protein [Paenibacillus tarimensis]|uniref:HPr family phosphocarrier protein n=1 Tax=Paenibacillus tarimensis TaxID=416012 RepID=UPI001F3CFF26|nr:HPr family phosphocarrier protein [Paenibacillus tarimensis]MCF2944269.1 HPr family phosphocarrier protein [Paenibacillus tarimensis]